MSHIYTIDVKIHNLEALKKAMKYFNWEFVENYDVRYYYGQTKRYDMAFRNPLASGYDIGVLKSADGAYYELEADTWGKSISDTLGQGMCRLFTRYNREVIEEQAQREYGSAYAISESLSEQGETFIRVEV